jgi:Protein of unknown function (DUF2891)
MKHLFTVVILVAFISAQAQTSVELTKTLADGRLTLSDKGASHFAKISLMCTNKIYPHYYHEKLEKAEDLQPPEKLWPSFYGCFDWHSGVHNHWALVKLLKNFPKIPEAVAIRQKLELSFKAENILAEKKYLETHQEEMFEYPYGTSWLLKVADELANWNDPTAKKWLKNLEPLTAYISNNYLVIWAGTEEATYTGNHYSSALGISFALDFARTQKNTELEKVLVEAAKRFYTPIKNFPFVKEPFGADFMSAGLLITDVMRKALPKEEFEPWLKKFSPDLFDATKAPKALIVKKFDDHNQFTVVHWDGFHLNRIWCLNGILKSISPELITTEVKKIWVDAQKEMWDYAQENIGKGNYDEDHWLSSFSVFALEGYK